MIETDDRCPCGTGETYGECCGRYLQDGRTAPTAEALMRSRYTGFATRAVHYLLATWHPSTRPDELELDEDMVWRRLDVLRTDAGGPWDDAGTVEFVAHYRLDDGTAIGQRGRLHETSRFVREDGRWLYVDGGIGA
jgi:SEC-C motif-containing protein